MQDEVNHMTFLTLYNYIDYVCEMLLLLQLCNMLFLTQVSHQPKVYVYDTPGIMPPKINNIEVGLKLALCGEYNSFSLIFFAFLLLLLLYALDRLPVLLTYSWSHLLQFSKNQNTYLWGGDSAGKMSRYTTQINSLTHVY